jgi:nitrate reductase gamma subunit
VFWLVFIIGSITLFVFILTYRTIRIASLPVHLRWELAPIPHERDRNKYGGSYLEGYEWWQQPRKKSFTAVIKYMAVEILLLRAIWKHNRVLWPLSLTFHAGIYLVILAVLLSVIHAFVSIGGATSKLLLDVAWIIAIIGYITGGLGVVGLILKRISNKDLRPFSSFTTYFNLFFLGAIFFTGYLSWLKSENLAADMSLIIKQTLTLDNAINISYPLSLHIGLSLVFLIYLPLTNMIHFVAKYFTYHEIRWDDEPQDEKMTAKIRGLMEQPVGWASSHIRTEEKKNWLDTSTGHEKT